MRCACTGVERHARARCRCRAGSGRAGSARTPGARTRTGPRHRPGSTPRRPRSSSGAASASKSKEGSCIGSGAAGGPSSGPLSRLLAAFWSAWSRRLMDWSPVWSIFGSSRRRSFSSSLSSEGFLTTIGRMKITSSLLVTLLVAIREQVTDARQVSRVGQLITVALHVVLHQPAQDRGLSAGELQHGLHLPDGDLRHLGW